MVEQQKRILEQARPVTAELDSLIAKMEVTLGKAPSVSPFVQLYAKYGITIDNKKAAPRAAEEVKGDNKGGKQQQQKQQQQKKQKPAQQAQQQEKITKVKSDAPAASGSGQAPLGQFPKTMSEYFEDSYLFTSSGNKVLGVLTPDGLKEGQHVVVLDRTICHPQGGGQPSDEGYLLQGNTKFILEAISMGKDDVISHVGRFEPAGATFATDSEVECHVDEAKRRLFARLHSAGHLLDVAMAKAGRTDLKPSKGYHFAAGAYVEYIGNVDANDREPLVATLNKNCTELLTQTPAEETVFKKMCSYDEANEQLAKAGGVPPYIPEGASLRVLKLVNDDAGCPCGGTHVQHVSDIQSITVTKIQKKGKNLRVSYGITPNV